MAYLPIAKGDLASYDSATIATARDRTFEVTAQKTGKLVNGFPTVLDRSRLGD
jgi:hypothetical protein